MHLRHRQSCRICGSTSLTPVIDLGQQYLQGSFVKPGQKAPPARKIECELVRCNPTIDENACGLLQMKHSVPPELLYTSYWYRSGTNQTMRDHLSEIAQKVIASVPTGATVLDIGCNDGTLLSNYPSNFKRFGVDPSDIGQDAKKFGTIYKDLFPSLELIAEIGKYSCDAITSIAMFYDLESPLDFCKAIREMLKPQGIWIFEMSYMPLMLEMNSYDTICHEHLEYYSLAVIERLMHLSRSQTLSHRAQRNQRRQPALLRNAGRKLQIQK